jgi:hypothetical protein
VVKPQSAKFPGKESFSATIPANHMDMTKFRSKDDIGFQRVFGRLYAWVKKLHNEIEPLGEGEPPPGK